jgi:signal transduction histidine kinase
MLDRIETLMDGVRHVSNAIAHDLRTPLTRILTSLEAAGRSESPAAMRAAHEVAIHEIEVLTQLLEKLLQIAEAEAGTHRQAFRPTNLDRIADDVVDLFAAVAEDRGAQLQRQADARPVVLGDSDLLAGAVANLVDNALKHTGAGTRILVATGWADGAAVVTVEDNGPGVPAAAHPSLGQRFFRRNPSVPGFGLGLTSVRAIVNLHGGSIRFEDAAPGLRVQIRLPVLVG